MDDNGSPAENTPATGGLTPADSSHASHGDVVSLDEGHIEGTGALPARFDNPGLPPHILRHADVDEKASKRAERQVLALFTLSILGTLGFLVAYFLVDMELMVAVPLFGRLSALHTLLGLMLAASLLGIGFGAVHWAKTLMPDDETVEERHPVAASPEDRQGFAETLTEGRRDSQLGRRPLIGVLGATAVGIFALPPVVQAIGGLGPLPGRELKQTFWQKGMRLVRDPELTPIRADDLRLGSVFHVLPEGIDGPVVRDKPDEQTQHDQDLGFLERKAKAATLLIRLDPDDFESQKARDWGYQGIVAYNKICTHAGCPVGLYEQGTHHLLCPCHQSTFDVTQDCKVVFGPAKRALPQLKITVDDEGYLIAAQPYMEPVGPSHWSRLK